MSCLNLVVHLSRLRSGTPGAERLYQIPIPNLQLPNGRPVEAWSLGVGRWALGVRNSAYFCLVLYLSKKSKVCLRISGWAHASVCMPPMTGSHVALMPFAFA